MTIAIGSKVSVVDSRGPAYVFTVRRIVGDYVCGDHHDARLDVVRPWQPGDDEAVRHREDIRTCSLFAWWERLTAEDAATVAAVLRRYGGMP